MIWRVKLKIVVVVVVVVVMIISVILILNIVIIFIIIKFKKNIITFEEKPHIWFEMIKNYKNLSQTGLIL